MSSSSTHGFPIRTGTVHVRPSEAGRRADGPGLVVRDPAGDDGGAPPSAIPVGWEEGRRLLDVVREASLAAERVAILDTLRQVRWNRKKAAEMLGVSYKTLLNKIKETGIEPPSAARA